MVLLSSQFSSCAPSLPRFYSKQSRPMHDFLIHSYICQSTPALVVRALCHQSLTLPGGPLEPAVNACVCTSPIIEFVWHLAVCCCLWVFNSPYNSSQHLHASYTFEITPLEGEIRAAIFEMPLTIHSSAQKLQVSSAQNACAMLSRHCVTRQIYNV